MKDIPPPSSQTSTQQGTTIPNTITFLSHNLVCLSNQSFEIVLYYLSTDFDLLLFLIATILVYANRPCNMYPPMIKTKVLSGLEKLNIL